ncbi:MAG: YggL family protein [Vicinamibacterales bacterium]
MNRRQRRKHRTGEFQELGFDLQFTTPAAWSDEQQLAFWNALIDEVEKRGMSIGGSSGEPWEVFVTGVDHASVTPVERQAIVDWLTAREGVANLEAGPLEDAWTD